MLMHMAPSSPPVKRTLHLLKTPDILLANDNGVWAITQKGKSVTEKEVEQIPAEVRKLIRLEKERKPKEPHEEKGL
jgi:hypothetical protein